MFVSGKVGKVNDSSSPPIVMDIWFLHLFVIENAKKMPLSIINYYEPTSDL